MHGSSLQPAVAAAPHENVSTEGIDAENSIPRVSASPELRIDSLRSQGTQDGYLVQQIHRYVYTHAEMNEQT